MGARRADSLGRVGIQAKVLAIILPLVIVPVLVLAAVGYVKSSDDASKAGARFLAQRDVDLRSLSENPALQDFYFNQFYGLEEEAAIQRAEIERWLLAFARRSNAQETIYTRIRYLDPQGQEIVKIEDGVASPNLGSVGETSLFQAVRQLPPDQSYSSAVAEEMAAAMPLHTVTPEGTAILIGAVALDFRYPLEEFRSTTLVIGVTFVATALFSLALAVPFAIVQVRRLTLPIRRLSEAARRIASGERAVRVDVRSRDEIGELAASFDDMATSLETQEQALRHRSEENRALFEIGQEISAQVDLAQTLQLIVARARELLEADVGLLALREEGADGFAVQAVSGEGADRLQGLRFRAGEGVGGAIIEEGQPIRADDYLVAFADSPFAPVIEQTGLHAVVAVPLCVRDAVAGVLYAFCRVPAKFSDDDLRLLEALATQAVISIENAKLYQQVIHHAEELERTVAARTRELQAANARLAEASHHKSAFLANMSHELRTPLNAIIGFTRLVMRKCKDILPEKHYENLEKILISSEHLLGLINAVLDLSKIEAGRMEVHATRFRLRPLVDLCMRTVEPLIDQGNVQAVLEVPDTLHELETDQDKLKQILINLMSNAAKFTHVGTIRVAARAHGDDITISVSDTGIGIPEGKLSLIFEEFQQVDDSPTRPYGGTGLGLSISLKMARLLGGNISVESTLGKGSTFTLTVPRKLLAAQLSSTTAVPTHGRER